MIHLGTLILLIQAGKQSYGVVSAPPIPNIFLPGPSEIDIFFNRFQCQVCYSLQAQNERKITKYH